MRSVEEDSAKCLFSAAWIPEIMFEILLVINCEGKKEKRLNCARKRESVETGGGVEEWICRNGGCVHVNLFTVLNWEIGWS